ncbi:hypothetical protein DGG96_14580 [Legionella qingyii]|uniref:Uncharacterized protein n=1 Tax=Legionella qingyii TaxID=2184757 RepID=A0A317U280_9GAMM|nr:hypothetical protein DGG96_14580 [Legionella qingyii]
MLFKSYFILLVMFRSVYLGFTIKQSDFYDGAATDNIPSNKAQTRTVIEGHFSLTTYVIDGVFHILGVTYFGTKFIGPLSFI